MIKRIPLLLVFTISILICSCAKTPSKISPSENKDSQTRLLNGNKRFIDSLLVNPNQSSTRRLELAKGQKPFAVILCCSDSRVPPEIIFDQGLGDLFVIRLAGNVLNDEVIGSIEYAVEHLGVKYVMVLGHERCGAVEAAIKGGATHYAHIESIVKAIRPALEEAKDQPGNLLDNTVKLNVVLAVKQLHLSEPVLKELVKKEKLKIVGAHYDLDDGKVEILNQ